MDYQSFQKFSTNLSVYSNSTFRANPDSPASDVQTKNFECLETPGLHGTKYVPAKSMNRTCLKDLLDEKLQAFLRNIKEKTLVINDLLPCTASFKEIKLFDALQCDTDRKGKVSEYRDCCFCFFSLAPTILFNVCTT